MKKKGTKFGFWHKVFVKIDENDHFLICKSEKKVKHDILIIPETIVDFYGNDNKKFLIRNPDQLNLIFSTNDENVCNAWVQELREIALNSHEYTIERFDTIRVLGKGSYGKVILAKDKLTNNFYAIKTIKKSRIVQNGRVSTIFNERNILSKLDNPFIVRTYFAFQTDTKFCFGLEYVSGGELFHYLSEEGTLTINEVRLYIAEITSGLEYLHSVNIIYRDLKPENVLIDEDGHIKLTDFGLAKDISEDSKASTLCGTLEYLAPEVVKEEKPYGVEVDWWGLGILTYEMLFGDPPFCDENKTKLFKKICEEEPIFPDNTDQATISFIKGLLNKNSEERLKYQQIISHPFFNGINFDYVNRKMYKPKFIPKYFTRTIDVSDTSHEFITGSESAPVRVEYDEFSFCNPKLINNF